MYAYVPLIEHTQCQRVYVSLSVVCVCVCVCVSVCVSKTTPRGHQQLTKEEVHRIYRGSHVPLRVTEYSTTGYHGYKMVQFLDLFSIPEATLFANVMEVRVH